MKEPWISGLKQKHFILCLGLSMLEVSDGDGRGLTTLHAFWIATTFFACAFPLSPVHLVKSIILVPVTLQPLPTQDRDFKQYPDLYLSILCLQELLSLLGPSVQSWGESLAFSHNKFILNTTQRQNCRHNSGILEIILVWYLQLLKAKYWILMVFSQHYLCFKWERKSQFLKLTIKVTCCWWLRG